MSITQDRGVMHDGGCALPKAHRLVRRNRVALPTSTLGPRTSGRISTLNARGWLLVSSWLECSRAVRRCGGGRRHSVRRGSRSKTRVRATMFWQLSACCSRVSLSRVIVSRHRKCRKSGLSKRKAPGLLAPDHSQSHNRLDSGQRGPLLQKKRRQGSTFAICPIVCRRGYLLMS